MDMFSAMFGWLGMFDNYEDRKVDRYEDGDLMISTARVTDAVKPFETAVAHPSYNSGKIIIVETYDTIDEAREGHARWVEKMTAEELPEQIIDHSGAGIASLLDIADPNDWRTFKRQDLS